jgi:hypothetical protein
MLREYPMRTLRFFLIPAGLSSLLIFGCASPQVRSETSAGRDQADGKELKYSRIATGDYQAFVVNWDDQRDPALYAVLQSPEQFAAILHPAPTNPPQKAIRRRLTSKRSKSSSYRELCPHRENMDKVFEVQRVTASGQELTLHYQIQVPAKDASFSP